jgi:nucleoside-diphosphate-sugar epimerase
MSNKILITGAAGNLGGLLAKHLIIGQVSYYGYTTRMREELLSKLKYKTYHY